MNIVTHYFIATILPSAIIALIQLVVEVRWQRVFPVLWIAPCNFNFDQDVVWLQVRRDCNVLELCGEFLTIIIEHDQVLHCDILGNEDFAINSKVTIETAQCQLAMEKSFLSCNLVPLKFIYLRFAQLSAIQQSLLLRVLSLLLRGRPRTFRSYKLTLRS